MADAVHWMATLFLISERNKASEWGLPCRGPAEGGGGERIAWSGLVWFGPLGALDVDTSSHDWLSGWGEGHRGPSAC